MSTAAAEELQLQPGSVAVAVVKATTVIVETARPSTRIARRRDSTLDGPASQRGTGSATASQHPLARRPQRRHAGPARSTSRATAGSSWPGRRAAQAGERLGPPALRADAGHQHRPAQRADDRAPRTRVAPDDHADRYPGPMASRSG